MDVTAERGQAGRAAFRFIFVTAVLNAISFSLVIPVLPNLVRQFTGGDTADAAEWMMLFAAAWGLTQFVFSPVLGALSDRVGRRPVLLVSIFGLGLDFVLIAFAGSLEVLLLARIISGATSATFPTAHAYVADVTPVEGRPAAFGRLAASISLGFIAGPALGGWLGEIDLRLPFLAAAGVCLANGLYGVLVLPESLPPERRSRRPVKPLFTSAGLALLRERPAVARLAAVAFLDRMANTVWGSIWVLFCAHRFGWSAGEMGLQILAAGLLGLGVQAWAVGRVVNRVGAHATLLIGAAVSAGALAWAALSPNGWWFVASMPFAAFGLLLGPGLQGLLSAGVGPDEQGRMQGTVQGLNGVATTLGPLIYGVVFAWSLRTAAPIDLSGLALLIGAGLLAGAFALALTVRPSGAEGVPAHA